MSHVPRSYYLRFKIVHYYLIPLVSLVAWWGMLIALMVCWAVQGHPEYGESGAQPVYISDIGATNLQPLFISCVGFLAMFFVGTLLMELVLRLKNKLQPYVSSKQPKLAVVSIIFGVIGQLGILFVAIFNTNAFHEVHLSMVALFIGGMFFSCLFNFFNSFIFGNYPSRLSPGHEKVVFSEHRWGNVYMVSFFLKCIWLIVAGALALLFGIYMGKGENGLSAIFEWSISFWYGLLLVLWAIDLFPSAVKHYRRRHPEEFDNSSKIGFGDLNDDNKTISFESPSYLDGSQNINGATDTIQGPYSNIQPPDNYRNFEKV